MKVCLTKGGLVEEVAVVAGILHGSHLLGILYVLGSKWVNKNSFDFLKPR